MNLTACQYACQGTPWRSAAGALAFAFPHAVEAVHPHRKGEADILASIKTCAVVLMGVGELYSFVGGQNLQVSTSVLASLVQPALRAFDSCGAPRNSAL